MSVIFDLKQTGSSWADRTNESIGKSNPQYFNQYGKVGSDDWWLNYEKGKIPKSEIIGMISFVGEKKDFCEENWDIVEIESENKLVTYDRLGYWIHPSIKLGAKLRVEKFVIEVPGKYGITKCHFEKLVEIIE